MALAPSLRWLLVGRMISGITSASIGAAFAYIADTSPPEKRAASYGLVGAAFGLGFILGPALGGVVGAISPRLPFWISAGMSLLNGLYGLLVLPESLGHENRRPFGLRANPLGPLVLVWKRASLAGLVAVTFLRNLSHVVYPAVFVLYAGYRYHWQAREVGLALAAYLVRAQWSFRGRWCARR